MVEISFWLLLIDINDQNLYFLPLTIIDEPKFILVTANRYRRQKIFPITFVIVN